MKILLRCNLTEGINTIKTGSRGKGSRPLAAAGTVKNRSRRGEVSVHSKGGNDHTRNRPSMISCTKRPSTLRNMSKKFFIIGIILSNLKTKNQQTVQKNGRRTVDRNIGHVMSSLKNQKRVEQKHGKGVRTK